MAITDKRFNEHLDKILSTTTRILKEQNPGDYAITVFIITRDTVHINALLALDDTSDVYTALREFGNTVRRTVGSPLAVFVGAEAVSNPGTEAILIRGCTPDKRTNAGNVIIARDSTNNSCTIEVKPKARGGAKQRGRPAG